MARSCTNEPRAAARGSIARDCLLRLGIHTGSVVGGAAFVIVCSTLVGLALVAPACSTLADDCRKTLTCTEAEPAALNPYPDCASWRRADGSTWSSAPLPVEGALWLWPDGARTARDEFVCAQSRSGGVGEEAEALEGSAGEVEAPAANDPDDIEASDRTLGVPPGLAACVSADECEPGQLCDPYFAVCVGCVSNADCRDPGAPRCDGATRECTGCANDADCGGTLPVCGADGRCVGCRENAHCTTNAAPRCADGTCAACERDEDCAHLSDDAVCTPTGCAECRSDTDCADPALPVCSDGRCSGCQSDTDCARFPGASACTPGGACVECTENRHCTDPLAPRCEGVECRPCVEQSDCSHLDGLGVCDTSTSPRQCVQCTRDDESACRTLSGAPLLCHSLERRCTEHAARSAGPCEPCVSDAQCRNPIGDVCALHAFDGVEVGYFCTPRADAPSFDGNPACGQRVLQLVVEGQVSIDGAAADLCLPEHTTCLGLADLAADDFFGADCGNAGVPDDALCGASGVDDGVCVAVGQVVPTFRCRVPCIEANDCPTGTVCQGQLCRP